MPSDPASLGKTLTDLGGFALFLLHVVLVDGYGLLRQWWVPGYLYLEVRKERDDLKVELKAANKTIERMTVQLARERRSRVTDRRVRP